MAYDYNQIKKQYEWLNDEQKRRNALTIAMNLIARLGHDAEVKIAGNEILVAAPNNL